MSMDCLRLEGNKTQAIAWRRKVGNQRETLNSTSPIKAQPSIDGTGETYFCFLMQLYASQVWNRSCQADKS